MGRGTVRRAGRGRDREQDTWRDRGRERRGIGGEIKGEIETRDPARSKGGQIK